MNRTRRAGLVAALAAVLVSWSVTAYFIEHQSTIITSTPQAMVSEASGPLPVSLDGAYYTRLAREMRSGEWTARDGLRGKPNPAPRPPLPLLGAWTAQALDTSTEWTAFYLPPVLGGLLAVALALWGWSVGGAVAAFCAALAGACSLFWVMIAGVGRFDTDCLNPALALLTAFCTWRFTSGRGHVRWVWLAGAAAFFIILAWWWRPGVFFAGAAVFSYGLTFFLPSPRVERAAKFAVLGCFAFLGLCVVLGLGHLLPPPLDGLANYGAGLLAFLSGGAGHQAARHIDELSGAGFGRVAQYVSGNALIFALSLAGLGLMMWRRRAAACFLAPMLAVGLAGFMAVRFVLFLFPLCALGLGCAVQWAVDQAGSRWSRNTPWPATVLAGVALSVILVLPSFLASRDFRPMPVLGRPHLELAGFLKQVPEDTVVWSWWTYGYFIQYAADRPTFFDGGSQTDLKAFAAGYALTRSDPLVAAGWMKFISARGVGAMLILEEQAGSMGRALAFLSEIFRDPQGLREAMKRYGISVVSPEWFFFPKQDCALYLPASIIFQTASWWDQGTAYDMPGGEPALFMLIPGSEAKLAPDGRSVEYQGRSHRFDRLVRCEDMNPADPWAAFEKGSRFLVVSGASPFAYLVDKAVTRTLAFNLLVPVPVDPPGFRTLVNYPAVGGAWMVE